MKNDIIINPEGLSPIPIDKTIKKYPVMPNLNLLADNSSRVNLRTPQMPPEKRNPVQSAEQDRVLKRSLTDQPVLKRHASMDIKGVNFMKGSSLAIHTCSGCSFRFFKNISSRTICVALTT